MTALEQIDDLRRFAETLPAEELEGATLDEIYDRWREGQAVSDEDVQAVREALDDLERGERGEPVDDFLARERAARAAKRAS